jgi:hypothetical protein
VCSASLAPLYYGFRQHPLAATGLHTKMNSIIKSNSSSIQITTISTTITATITCHRNMTHNTMMTMYGWQQEKKRDNIDVNYKKAAFIPKQRFHVSDMPKDTQ